MPTVEKNTSAQLAEYIVAALFMEFDVKERAVQIGNIITFLRSKYGDFPDVLNMHFDQIEKVLKSEIIIHDKHDRTGAELCFNTATMDSYSSHVCIYGDPFDTRVTVEIAYEHKKAFNFTLDIFPDRVEYNFE